MMTKSKILLTILMLTTCISFSQTAEEIKYGKIVLPDSMVSQKLSLSDSLVLNQLATELIKAFETKDTKKIKRHSLKLIHCQLCTSKEYSLIIPLDSFISEAYKEFDDFMFDCFKKRGVRISKMLMRDFYPKYLSNCDENNLLVYEARITSYEPNELNDESDGLNYCFYFVKIKKKFKFFLYNSIPK